MVKGEATLKLLLIVFLSFFVTQNALALTYSSDVGVRFTFNPTLEISLSSADLLIPNLSPGTVSDSNIIDVIVKTNNITGYTLNATVGNNTTYNTRNLVHELSGSSASFASINYGSSLANLTADNTWGYSYSTNDRTTWSNYDGLPIYSDATNIATLKEATSPSVSAGDIINFKIAAKASTAQASGEYNNVINFVAIANPVPTLGPVACESGKICYNANAINPTDVECTMGKPDASANTAITLLASNFSREGYGFAGWSDTYDYTGNLYGPQEDITTPTDMSNGLPLYAIWVQSAGSMQSDASATCNSLTSATTGFKSLTSVSALTDERDNETYAIAKLADGNCWMIENLRLENTAAHNSDGALAQGYGALFAGLANPENSWTTSNPRANSLYYSGTQEGTASINIGVDDDPGYRFPRYNNTNNSATSANRPQNPITNDATNSNTHAGIYSYGNYYTWHASIADASYRTGHITTTSVCPAGWRLPTGGQITIGSPTDFYILGKSIMVDADGNGIEPIIPVDNNGRYDSTQLNVDGENASMAFRGYPNNFILSGCTTGNSFLRRGGAGFYWSSSSYINSSIRASALDFDSSVLLPGSDGGTKDYARNIRCVASSAP